MKNSAAKKMMDWQEKQVANKPETILDAAIAWTKINDEKGRGIIALRDIKKGEVVETAPVVPVSEHAINRDYGGAPDGYLLDWDGDYEDELYCMPLGYIMAYNHSDEPNIALDQDYEAYTMTVTALRDIKAGEELCWNYACDIWFDKE